MAEVTDKEIEQEKKFMEGIPRLNLGALFLPPIWGPAHGIWATILFYPLWLFADNAFYAAWSQPSPLAVVVALVVGVTLAGGTIAFAVLVQPFAAHRATSKGVGKDAYVRRERIWALGCGLGALAMLAWATYFNILVRPTLG